MRSITVNGVKHEYLIGHTYVKIKGLGLYKIDDITRKTVFARDCGCGEGKECPRAEVEEVITPSVIRELIETNI